MSELEWRAPETAQRERGIMVKCKCKTGGAIRVTIDTEVRIISVQLGSRATGFYYQRKVAASSYVRTERTMDFLTWAHLNGMQAMARCLRCGSLFKADPIVGTKNTTPCDGRCTHAKGHECNCSCGGENHGSGL